MPSASRIHAQYLWLRPYRLFSPPRTRYPRRQRGRGKTRWPGCSQSPLIAIERRHSHARHAAARRRLLSVPVGATPPALLEFRFCPLMRPAWLACAAPYHEGWRHLEILARRIMHPAFSEHRNLMAPEYATCGAVGSGVHLDRCPADRDAAALLYSPHQQDLA